MADAPKSKGLLALQTEVARAFSWWNKRRFGGRLSQVMLGFHPQPSNGSKARLGHYQPGAWVESKELKARVAEIVLYADLCLAAGALEVQLTLVHEMVHHRQAEQGKPGKGGHNREWHRMAAEAGLITAGPQGLGPSGPGSDAGPVFLADVAAFGFRVENLPFRALTGKKRQKGKMRRWSCPTDCNGSIRAGKREISLVCGICGETLQADDDGEDDSPDDAD